MRARQVSAVTVAWLMFTASAGCIEDTGDELGLPEADYPLFVGEVQPVLEERCANPSCHGTDLRPLEIYATMQHRKSPSMVHVDAPLTEDELIRNFDRARGFLLDATRPDDSPLLSKPLAMAAGGSAHLDVDVFDSTDDPEYDAIRDWIADALARDGEDAG